MKHVQTAARAARRAAHTVALLAPVMVLTATLAGYAPWHGTTKVRGPTGVLFAKLTRAK